MKKALLFCGLFSLLSSTLPVLSQTKSVKLTSEKSLENWYPIWRKPNYLSPAFINKKGETVLSFDSTCHLMGTINESVFRGEYTAILKLDTWTYYLCDRRGQLTPLPDKLEVERMNQHSITVRKGDKWGLMSFDMKLLTPLKYEGINSFNEGLAVAEIEKNGHFTLLNEQGEETIPSNHVLSTPGSYTTLGEPLKSVHEGYTLYSQDGKLGVMDIKGNEITPAKFKFVYWFNSGLAYAGMEDRIGYINTKGDWAFESMAGTQYTDPFSDEIAPVFSRVDNKSFYQYINTKGKPAFPATFSEAGQFNHGYAVVRPQGMRSGEWVDTRQIINRSGEQVFTAKFSAVFFLDDLIAVSTEEGNNKRDVGGNNFTYYNYDFKKVWEPDCSSRMISNLVGIEKCDPKIFQDVVLFKGRGAYSLAEISDFLNKINPRSLQISFDKSVTRVPDIIAQMTNLQKLSFPNTDISQLPADMSKLTNLKELVLDYTQVTSFPPSLYKLKKLELISVRGLKISDEEMKKIRTNMPGVSFID